MNLNTVIPVHTTPSPNQTNSKVKGRLTRGPWATMLILQMNKILNFDPKWLHDIDPTLELVVLGKILKKYTFS